MLAFEDFVELSQAASTTPELLAAFQRAMALEGFENIILATICEGRLTDVGWHAFPERYFENYLEQGWDRVDPLLEYSLRAPRAFLWDEVVPRLNLSLEQSAFMEEARRQKIHSCITMPFQSRGGRRGILGVSKRDAQPPDPARVPVLHAMCAQAWVRYVELSHAHAGLADFVPLTEKELEILKWVKHGKSNSEIAEILSLSIKTVEYHVTRILKKLGASNRVTAVVTAIQNSIIEL